VHTVGSSEVQWRSPDFPPTNYPQVHNHDVLDYEGKWQIPQIEEPAFRPKNSEVDQWSRVSVNYPSFIRELTKEVVRLSYQNLSFFDLSIANEADFRPFLETHGLNDDEVGRSHFRMSWWIAGKENSIVCG
jgi:hypothetical protein